MPAPSSLRLASEPGAATATAGRQPRATSRWRRCLGVPERRPREHDRGQAAGRRPRRRGAAGRGRRLRPHDQPAQPGLLLRRVPARRRPGRLRRQLLGIGAVGARLARLRLLRLLLRLVRVVLRGGGVPAERRRWRGAAARYLPRPGRGSRAAPMRMPRPGVRWLLRLSQRQHIITRAIIY